MKKKDINNQAKIDEPTRLLFNFNTEFSGVLGEWYALFHFQNFSVTKIFGNFFFGNFTDSKTQRTTIIDRTECIIIIN